LEPAEKWCSGEREARRGRVRRGGAAEAAVWRRHGWGGHWGGGAVLGCSSIWG